MRGVRKDERGDKVARPTKQGVDYFPLDVHLDNKFKFIEIKFGLEGFAIVIKMLQEIYANSYYCDWGNDEQLLFSDEHKIKKDTLQEITHECVERKIFNKRLYENYNILTSKGIQKRYKEIVRRRKDVHINTDYLLIDGDWGVNDVINTSLGSHDDDKSTQSKVKESKVNKSKEDYHSKIKDLLSHFKSVNDFVQLNKNYWNTIRETRVRKTIADSVIYNNMKLWKNYDLKIVEYALKEHIKNHKGKKEEYTIGIMRNTSKSEAEQRLSNLTNGKTRKVADF